MLHYNFASEDKIFSVSGATLCHKFLNEFIFEPA